MTKPNTPELAAFAQLLKDLPRQGADKIKRLEAERAERDKLRAEKAQEQKE